MTLLAGSWLWTQPGNAEEQRKQLAQLIGSPAGAIRTVADGCALGVDLLQFLPEDAHDRQPLSGSSIALVADIRLDNRADLSSDLGLDAAQSALLSDSDILHLCWRRWKADCLPRLIGDFAVAVWDADSRCLHLARDFGGQRPLHYIADPAGVLFASLPSSLAKAAGRAPQLDRLEWATYLTGMPQTGCSTMFAGVSRVKPGTVVTFDYRGQRRIRKFWDPDLSPVSLSFDDAVERARDLLDQAVVDRMRTRSGVIAAQLSSGLDSSAVVTSAALRGGHHLAALTGEPAANEIADVGGRHGDEGLRASALAALYPGMDHQLVRVPTRPIAHSIQEWNCQLDQPVRNYANMHWLGETYQAASARGASVMLTGNYGNLSISYDGLPRFSEMLRNGHLSDWYREGRLYRNFTGTRVRGVVALSLGGYPPPAVWGALQRLAGKAPSNIVGDSFLNPTHPIAAEMRARSKRLHPPVDGRPGTDSLGDRLSGVSSVDNALLHHAFAHRYGVDTRDPTHDRRLVEFILRLPTRIFLHEGRHRSLARGILKGRAPTSITNLPTRGIQGGDFRASVLLSQHELASEIDAIRAIKGLNDLLDLPRLQATLDRCRAGNWDGWGQMIRAIGLANFARTRFDII